MLAETRRPPAMTATVLLVTLALIAPLTGAARAQAEYEDLRTDALNCLGAHIHAGQRDAALAELAVHVARHPGDALMQYNLACLLASSGEPDKALDHLGVALTAGYRDWQRVRTSPDLVSLADDPRLDALLATVQNELLDRMLGGGLSLVEGDWSDRLILRPCSFGPLPEAADGGVRFRFDRDHLIAEVVTPAGGADELLVIIALPQSLELHETARWFELRVRLDGPGPAALTGRHGRRQKLPDAAQLERSTDRWTLRIPWSSLHPYRPPVELLFGLNVVLRRTVAPELPAQRWELISDPHAGSHLQPWRRFVPADLDPGLEPAPLLTGRLDTYLVIGDSVSVELGAQGMAGGLATLALRTGLQAPGAGADTTYHVDLEPDLSFVTVDLRLDHLPTPSWFTVAAELTTADGVGHAWQGRAFRLAPDWFVQQHARLPAIAPVERPIVQYQLIGTLRGQQAFHPHDDPTPLARSAAASMLLLDRGERTGSVLPVEACRQEAGFPTGHDQLLACQLVLPPAAVRQGGEVVLVIVAESEQATTAAALLHELRPADDQRSYMVTATRQIPGQPHSASPEIAAGRRWLEELLAPTAISIAGMASGAEMALHAALADTTAWRALLLFGAAVFDPDVLADPADIATRLEHGLGSLPFVLNLPAAAGQRTRSLVDLLPESVVERRADREDDLAAGIARILDWRP